MNNNLIVTLANYKYLNQAKQLFSSVYWNAGWDGDYMLLSHEIPEEELSWFTDKGILVKRCESLARVGEEYSNYPVVVLDKFYLFTPEFKKWKNVVYLDTDIIVKGSLDKLKKVKGFAAVTDLYNKDLKSQFANENRTIFNDVAYQTEVKAFNTGVFSFSTDLISDKTFDEINDMFHADYAEFRFPEQSVLNLYFYRKWRPLPKIFNVFIFPHNYYLPYGFKAIVYHFIAWNSFPDLWDKNNIFYGEWKLNLEKAESIDINNIQKVEKWNRCKIWFYSLFLRCMIPPKRLHYLMIGKVFSLWYFFSWAPERLVGELGLIIKKISPSIYLFLKQTKRNK
jgi:lipopolysaccharide biosynthesis glycosyltransferase